MVHDRGDDQAVRGNHFQHVDSYRRRLKDWMMWFHRDATQLDLDAPGLDLLAWLLLLRHAGPAEAFAPNVNTLTGDTELLGDLPNEVMARSHSRDSGQLVFCCLLIKHLLHDLMLVAM